MEMSQTPVISWSKIDHDVYTKPLFSDKGTSVFKPEVKDTYDSEADYNKIKEVNKFIPDTGFTGVDESKGGKPRKEPVQVHNNTKIIVWKQ